jgi:hypothetical protein
VATSATKEKESGHQSVFRQTGLSIPNQTELFFGQSRQINHLNICFRTTVAAKHQTIKLIYSSK